ncbi:TIGR02594 family protein [Pseudorhodoplanes sp.]|uniref:TIGR02594 family protein n=1 Tax=Pseudorhodoplanes sp. TaxID=1934341 RepID=UPI0039C92ED7
MNCKLNVTANAIALTAIIATTIILTQSPAEARPSRHKIARHHHAAAVTSIPAYAGWSGAGYRHSRHAATPRRHVAHNQWRHARGAAPQASRVAAVSHASTAPATGFGSSLIATARSYLGTNPTGMSALWCARFMNMVLEKTGRRGTGSNMARSFADYGRRISGPQVGAIAVMSRGRGGGHVGIVSGIDKAGNPIIISGNHNRKVAEAVYSRGRIYAYVMP